MSGGSTEVLTIKPSDVAWIKSLHIPGAEDALNELQRDGEIVVIGES